MLDLLIDGSALRVVGNPGEEALQDLEVATLDLSDGHGHMIHHFADVDHHQDHHPGDVDLTAQALTLQGEMPFNSASHVTCCRVIGNHVMASPICIGSIYGGTDNCKLDILLDQHYKSI